MVGVKEYVILILKAKFDVHEPHRIDFFSCSNFQQLNMLLTQEQEEAIQVM
jgi:hypothetical protein